MAKPYTSSPSNVYQEQIGNEVLYTPSKTCKEFLKLEDYLVKLILGPLGSGKSVTCCFQLLLMAQAMPPDRDGVRRSKFAVIRNCFDELTEVLTDSGWKLFSQLTPTDKIATRLEDGSFIFEIPSYHYQAPYVGEMIGFESEGIDFLVTPDHKLLVQRRNARKKEWSAPFFMKAHEAYGKTNLRVLRAGQYLDAPEPKLTVDDYEFIGYWLAEGSKCQSTTQYIIKTVKNAEYCEDLLNRCRIKYSYYQYGTDHVFRVLSTNSNWIHILSSLGENAYTKAIPRELLNAPPEYLMALIKGWLVGDGNHPKNGCQYGTTASGDLADTLQEAACRCGYVANIRQIRNKDKWFFTVTFVKPSKYTPTLTTGSSSKYRGWYKQQYNGTVYCVEVSTHQILIRRNGITHWSSQTYRELADTTMRTWFDWFPANIMGKFHQMSMTHYISNRLDDGTTMEMEVLFRALDRPSDIKKVLSLEITAAWVNEAREIPREVVDGLFARTGRYPPRSPQRLIMDSNPPDEDHWIYKLFEEERPEGYYVFHQPSGLSKWAENTENLPPNYYQNLSLGKDPQWVKVYVHGEYGFVQDGLPIYEAFQERIHIMDVEYEEGEDILLGVDFGRTPAAVFAHEDKSTGQIRVFDELTTFNTPAIHFARLIRERLKGHYPESKVQAWGDPSGEFGSQTTDETCIDILNNNGIPIEAANTNNFTIRREAVNQSLLQLTLKGEPLLVISPRCRVLAKAMRGGYRYKRMQVNGEYFRNEPDKNQFSHVAEALQYLLLGLGRGDDVVASNTPPISSRKVLRSVQ